MNAAASAPIERSRFRHVHRLRMHVAEGPIHIEMRRSLRPPQETP